MPGSIFGPAHVGSWVHLWLVGGHDLTARIVNIGPSKVEVQERGADETWNVPDKSIAAWQIIAAPGSSRGGEAA